MAETFISKNEFAKRCGVRLSYVETYVRRNKISVLTNSDGVEVVDLGASLSASFAKKRGYDVSTGYSKALDPEAEQKVLSKSKSTARKKVIAKKGQGNKTTTEPEERVPINQPPQREAAQRPAPKGRTVADFLVIDFTDDVDSVKKKIEIQRLVEEAEISKLKKEKMQGLSIPTELVHAIFNRTFTGISIAFYEGAADLVQRMRHRYGASAKDGIELKTELEEIINQAIEKMQAVGESELEGVIETYKESRTKGERK